MSTRNRLQSMLCKLMDQITKSLIKYTKVFRPLPICFDQQAGSEALSEPFQRKITQPWSCTITQFCSWITWVGCCKHDGVVLAVDANEMHKNFWGCWRAIQDMIDHIFRNRASGWNKSAMHLLHNPKQNGRSTHRESLMQTTASGLEGFLN